MINYMPCTPRSQNLPQFMLLQVRRTVRNATGVPFVYIVLSEFQHSFHNPVVFDSVAQKEDSNVLLLVQTRFLPNHEKPTVVSLEVWVSLLKRKPTWEKPSRLMYNNGSSFVSQLASGEETWTVLLIVVVTFNCISALFEWYRVNFTYRLG